MVYDNEACVSMRAAVFLCMRLLAEQSGLYISLITTLLSQRKCHLPLRIVSRLGLEGLGLEFGILIFVTFSATSSRSRD